MIASGTSFETLQSAYGFNVPLIATLKKVAPEAQDSIIISAMKQACCCPDCSDEHRAAHPCPPGSWHDADNPYR